MTTESMTVPQGNARRLLTLLALIGMIVLAIIVFTPPPAAFADCKPDGLPAQAGTGISGSIDPATSDPSNANYYGNYGWAGLRWYTCDIGNTSFTKDNFAEIDTFMGSSLMGGAAFEGSLMTAMHKWTAQPKVFLEPIDQKVAQLSEVTRTVLFDQWIYPVIAFAALGVIMLAVTKKVRPAVMTVGVAALACGFVSIISTAPLAVAQSTDGVASSIVSAADAQALKYAGIPTGSAATDQKNSKGQHIVGANESEATGAVLNDAMLQPLWRLGELGSTDWTANSDALWRASVASWSEVKKGYKPETKRDDYNTAVDKVKNNQQTANEYTTIKGQSYNRTGAGFIALVEMSIVGAIRVIADALIFLGMLVMRFVPLFGPLFALLAIPEATRGAATAGLKVVAASIFNVIVFGVIAAVHTALIAVLYIGSVNAAGNIFVVTVLSALCTFFLLKISKPYRSVTRLATGTAVSQELHGMADGPGKMVRSILPLITGTAASTIGNFTADGLEGSKRKRGDRDSATQQIRPDASHSGAEFQPPVASYSGPEQDPAAAPQIHPDWMMPPPVNEHWNEAPDITVPGAESTGFGNRPETDTVFEPSSTRETWQSEWDEPMFTPEAATDYRSPTARAGTIDPEIDTSGHVVNTIFIPGDAPAPAPAQRIIPEVIFEPESTS